MTTNFAFGKLIIQKKVEEISFEIVDSVFFDARIFKSFKSVNFIFFLFTALIIILEP